LKPIAFFLLVTSILSGNDCCCLPAPNTLSIGPEFYQVHRTREGGTVQNGWISAGRATYDRIKAFGMYWGANALYGIGPLKGHTGFGDEIKSTFKDYQIEARVGFTFQTVKWIQPYITPFIGIGYRKEYNNFHEPSPLVLNFETKYPYGAFGVLSGVNICPQFSIGLNFKGEVMYDARCDVTGDQEMEDFTLLINDDWNYRIELPIIYRFCRCASGFEMQLTPFYEHRHYGGRENYPFDYIDTKLMLWGFNLLLSYRF